jgi:HSP20 family protein
MFVLEPNSILKRNEGGTHMNAIRYNPFQQMQSLQDEINRLFSANSRPSWGDHDQGLSRGVWNPHVDIYENKDQISLEVEIPGMSKDDIHLTFENNVLTLSGERRFENDREEKNYHRVERSYGSFTRSFTLPNTVSGDGITAEYRDGVLYLSLPKKEEVKARRIEIAGEGSAQKTMSAKAGR